MSLPGGHAPTAEDHADAQAECEVWLKLNGLWWQSVQVERWLAAHGLRRTVGLGLEIQHLNMLRDKLKIRHENLAKRANQP